MQATILYNPNCSKCRQALTLLEEAGAETTVVKYLQSPPSAAELDAILTKLGLEPAAIARKGEARFAELGLREKTLTRAEWLDMLVASPVLIERPIVIIGDRAVVGRPVERVKALLG